MCKWLFEVGAAADITETNNKGTTPMHMACQEGHLSVCQWLILNGALNRPAQAEHDDDYVDEAIVKRDTDGSHHRHALLAWAQDVAATHHTFLHVVLRASVILPASHHQQARHDHPCYLPWLRRSSLMRIGVFLGVEMLGRRVRNVREFAEALVVVMEEEA